MRAYLKLEVPPAPTPEQAKAGKKPPSLREQLEQVERTSGRRDPLLDSVRIPEGFEYLWALFWEARGGASDGFSGARLTWRDLEAFQAVTGIAFDAFEVDAIMAMDKAAAERPAEE